MILPTSEVLHPARIKVAESDGVLTVRAEVPGFKAKDLEISVEPRRITITGKRKSKEERNDSKVLYTEWRSGQFLRVVDLPQGMNAGRGVATLEDGILELKVPKAVPAKQIEIQSNGAWS